MKRGNFVFTSEAMAEGHPDKVCDAISDAVLDEILKQDKNARVACETMAGMGFVIVSGEITTSAYVNIPRIARSVIGDIGYDKPEYGFDYNTVGVLTSIHSQSPDIAQGVNRGDEIGAGDQGMMSGYATNETPEFMPLTIVLANKLAKRLADVRKDGTLPYLRPDGKTQVTVQYKNGKPEYATSIVVAAQHDPDVDTEKLREDIKREVIEPVCGDWIREDTKYYINNTGRFVQGGPVADCGMTGRKIIADTYGGAVSHGGGAFSGKDPTKVDKSAAYMARYIAKNFVAAGICEKCEVQLAYVIGITEPLSVMVDSFGTGKLTNEAMVELAKKHFKLSPKGIIEQLDLLRPIYRKTTCYGHFGRDDPDFTWEKTDLAETLREEADL
ncbi:MAG: methionine adenosyltransferase [Thermoplasmata archaeon]|nr:MAG: methionine adenosyltransferase [Thermoplasmata archaeon]